MSASPTIGKDMTIPLQPLIDSIIPFASTFFGVLSAFGLGIFGQRRERRRAENRLRSETKNSIAAELQEIQNQTAHLVDVWTDDSDTLFELVHSNFIAQVYFPTNAKESAVASGRFSLLELGLQKDVSYVYGLVARAIDYSARILDVPPGTMDQSARPMYSTALRTQLDHLMEATPPLIEKFETKPN